MHINELINIALSSIWANKMRSLLTMLGIIIGISAVVTIMAIGDGASTSITDQLGSLGAEKVTIQEAKGESLLPSERLQIEDVDRLRTRYPNLIKAITPSVSKPGTLQKDIEDPAVMMTGASGDSLVIDNLEILRGRAISDEDLTTRKNVIVIDSELSETLFGETSAVGQTLVVKNGPKSNQYIIVGIYEKTASGLGPSSAKIYVPYTTLDKNYNLKGEIEGISATMANKDSIQADAQTLIDYLMEIHRSTNENAYSYFSLDSMMQSVNTTLSLVTLLVSAVAGISLVVGGIGVMNIMMVTVTERTREIGIRKALGAKPLDIMTQFLVEAVVICFFGGVIGILAGYGFTALSASLMSMEMNITLTSVVFATAFSSMIGIIFGVYPARKASKLDPIEALRYE